ncbi:tape measure protein (plasmid) [Apilactobacillus apisilvae]|uniref:Tape measure protein n=2 Tax=Apilactobacillus apisilvae TaxID=2923364 RepID=A0ABY4PKD2_9LACO|nr:tape measure protein [Apilactobacillus apisilvae]
MPQGQINSVRSQLTQFAQDSIYNSSDMASAYSQFAAVGTKDSLKLVKGFGGLAAASQDPKQAMKTLSEQGTQMAAKPMVQWQDFKLMMDRTPAGISAVAKSMHESAGQLIRDVQSGKVKTQDFFDAVATTGTNKKFSAMATHYKTIGEALAGTKETLAQKIEPEWGNLSSVAIDAISNINNKIGGLNIKGLGNKLKPYLKSAIDWTIDTVSTATRDVKAFFGAFNDTGAIQNAAGIFNSIKTIIGKIFEPSNGKNKDPLKPFIDMGDFAGKVIKGLSNLVKAISQLDPGQVQKLAGSLLFLKYGMKGIAFSAVIWGLEQLSQMDPNSVKFWAQALIDLAFAFAVFKAVSGISQFIIGISQAKNALHDMFGFFKGGSSLGNTVAKSTGSFIKMGLGMIAFGAGVLIASAGLWIMSQAAIDLANAGCQQLLLWVV